MALRLSFNPDHFAAVFLSFKIMVWEDVQQINKARILENG